MRHAFLERMSQALADRRIATFRYEFLYMEKRAARHRSRRAPRSGDGPDAVPAGDPRHVRAAPALGAGDRAPEAPGDAAPDRRRGSLVQGAQELGTDTRGCHERSGGYDRRLDV